MHLLSVKLVFLSGHLFQRYCAMFKSSYSVSKVRSVTLLTSVTPWDCIQEVKEKSEIKHLAISIL